MFGRKQKLFERSQQYRAIGEALKVEGGKKILAGISRIGLSMVTGNVLSDTVQGYRGGVSIGEGFDILKTAAEYDEAAKSLEQKASEAKWWHL
jgi:hypothetical protein